MAFYNFVFFIQGNQSYTDWNNKNDKKEHN